MLVIYKEAGIIKIMIIDGKKTAMSLKKTLQKKISILANAPTLVVFVVGDNLSTKKFIALKKVFAEEVGVSISIKKYKSNDVSTQQLVDGIKNSLTEYDGVIVQFPLPPNIDKDIVRNTVPVRCDVDVISDEAILLFKSRASKVLPPVVGAIEEILKEQKILIKGKKVVVVGDGSLVGRPSAQWARQQGALVDVVEEKTSDMTSRTKEADVLILGAGVPFLIKPDMVKEGVIIFDAGTSELRGKLKGDADPACSSKASLFTPVPGGIGPITVAIIFKNLLILSKKSDI